MIHELRIYDLAPGRLHDYLHLAETVVPRARGDRFGRLVGFWHAESGRAERVFHVWEYDGLDQRQASRAELFRKREWLDEFIAHVWPIIERQQVVFLDPVGEQGSSGAPAGLYELRTTHAHTGAGPRLLEEIAGAKAADGTTCIRRWTGISSWPNAVVELFAHADSRGRFVANNQRGPGMAAVLERRAALSVSTESEWLVPIAISPLR